MEISFIVFCYNEAETIEEVVLKVSSFAKETKNSEIIVVNDGSNDKTSEILDTLVHNNKNLIIINHPKNAGIGIALRSGYAKSKYEYICAIPGDGQFDISELNNITPFTNDFFYSFYRTQTGYNYYRQSLTLFNRLFNRFILGITLRDVNWIKVYRKEQLDMVKPQLTSSLVESEICAKLKKHNITPIEIQSNYLARKHGVAKGGSWKTLKKAMADMINLWWVVYKYRPSNRF